MKFKKAKIPATMRVSFDEVREMYDALILSLKNVVRLQTGLLSGCKPEKSDYLYMTRIG